MRSHIERHDYHDNSPILLPTEIEQVGELLIVQAELILSPERAPKTGNAFKRPIKRAEFLTHSQFPRIKETAESYALQSSLAHRSYLNELKRRNAERTRQNWVAALGVLTKLSHVISEANGPYGDPRRGPGWSDEDWYKHLDDLREQERIKRETDDLMDWAWGAVGTDW